MSADEDCDEAEPRHVFQHLAQAEHKTWRSEQSCSTRHDVSLAQFLCAPEAPEMKLDAVFDRMGPISSLHTRSGPVLKYSSKRLRLAVFWK